LLCVNYKTNKKLGIMAIMNRPIKTMQFLIYFDFMLIVLKFVFCSKYMKNAISENQTVNIGYLKLKIIFNGRS